MVDQMKRRASSVCKEHMLDEWEQLNSPHILAEKLDTNDNIKSPYVMNDLLSEVVRRNLPRKIVIRRKISHLTSRGDMRFSRVKNLRILLTGERMYDLLKENGVSLKTRKHDVTLADDTTQSKETLTRHTDAKSDNLNVRLRGPRTPSSTPKASRKQRQWIENCSADSRSADVQRDSPGSYEVANLDNPNMPIGRHHVSTLKPFTDIKTTPTAPLRKTDAVFSTSSNSETG
ncbi:hypothetical protein CEXT_742961 [Caerostris extrusa]|uniref:Uncharacterized protein n=1 Tax=Caerostris extrusa TaxID=172846 RepID=A0AAV4VZM0_CAEEX|nr:hypothetical protein CEXT_742961 [Caerostris extrusa]